jgi:hypothetical protein
MLRLSIKDSSGERIFATERDEILVGSREGADLRLADPAAAPNHCVLRAAAGRVRLVTLAPGGATVGGRRVGGEATLDRGAEFAIGATVVRVVACGNAVAPKLQLDEPRAAPPPPTPPPPAAPPTHGSDFAHEVRQAVAKAPWYMISLVAHVLLLLLLNLIETAQPRLEVVAEISAMPNKPLAEPEVAADTPLALDALEDEPSLDIVEFEEPPSQEVRKTPSDGDLVVEEDVKPPDPIGAAGSRRVRLATPLPYAKKMAGADETLNKADLDGEQGRATDEVKRGLGDGLHKAKQRLTREHIVVVRGEFDKIEDILDKYGWPYTLVSRDELLQLSFPKARLLFVNCARRPPPAQCPKIAETVKRFLSRGCWVVTSDWAVDPYVTLAFPTHVHVGAREKTQRDTTVSVEPCGSDMLLTGVFPRGGDSAWWLEDSSTMVTVTDKATTLVESDDMQRRYGSRVVAFKFAYGSGIVLHLVGHFYQKDGNRRGLVAMHRLLNNVILERVEADEKR